MLLFTLLGFSGPSHILVPVSGCSHESVVLNVCVVCVLCFIGGTLADAWDEIPGCIDHSVANTSPVGPSRDQE